MSRFVTSLLRRKIFAFAMLLVLASPLYADTNTSLGDRTGEGTTPFTGLAHAPEANLFTGALTTGIKIEVPPGRKNLTPQLTLRYSSQNGPSPFGFGWDLPLGRIERSTKWGVPRCSGPHTDDFVLILPGSASELVADPPGSDTYRPKVEESFIEARKSVATNSWTVYDRAGMKYVFGASSTARVGNDVSTFMTVNPDGSCNFTTAWALTRVEDPHGNTMDVIYYTVDNVLYPRFINYGGNARNNLEHFYHAIFTYEAREEVESHRNGAQVILRKRLQRVEVTADYPELTTIRTYLFTYDAVPDAQAGYRSMLNAVQLVGYPEQLLVYSGGAAGSAPQPGYIPPPLSDLRYTSSSQDVYRTVLDMNGDGFLDILDAKPAGDWDIYLGSENGFASSANGWWAASTHTDAIRGVDGSGSGLCTSARPCTDFDVFDITGDGIPDFVDAHENQWADCDNDSNLEPIWTVFPGGQLDPEEQNGYVGKFASGSTSDPGVAWCAPRPFVRLDRRTDTGDPDDIHEIWTYQDTMDINGDGLPDLIWASQPTDDWQSPFPGPEITAWQV